MARRSILAVLVLAALLAGSYGVVVWACAVEAREGAQIETLEEDALIVWDAETKTEHFIRQAKFSSSVSDFGFLVPTPTQPQLAEADPQVFFHLEMITRPEVRTVVVKKKRPPPAPPSDPRTSAAEPVDVLDRTTVAGYDAAVLKATDVDALAEWLKSNGYAFRPALREWLKEYTDNGWIITAFKLSADSPGAAQTKAVQMSFQAEKPFYPYREPADARDPSKEHQPRKLRLFVLSDEAVEGKLGESLGGWRSPVWSDEVSAARIESSLLRLKLPKELHREKWWLTEFEDRASPRQGTDELYFDAVPNADVIHRPYIVRKQIEYYDDVIPAAAPVAGPTAAATMRMALAWPLTFGVVLLIVVTAVIAAVVAGFARSSRTTDR